MAQPSTLYRFQIALSDIERGIYEQIDFRTAQHPSESTDYLLTRVVAFALNYQQDLEFSPQGLGDPDAPALRKLGQYGTTALWIEVGSPSARRLHKAGKAAEVVKIYTYKAPQVLISEINSHDVFGKDKFEIYAMKAGDLARLAETLKRDNIWSVVFNDGLLSVNVGDTAFDLEITRHLLST